MKDIREITFKSIELPSHIKNKFRLSMFHFAIGKLLDSEGRSCFKLFEHVDRCSPFGNYYTGIKCFYDYLGYIFDEMSVYWVLSHFSTKKELNNHLREFINKRSTRIVLVKKLSEMGYYKTDTPLE